MSFESPAADCTQVADCGGDTVDFDALASTQEVLTTPPSPDPWRPGSQESPEMRIERADAFSYGSEGPNIPSDEEVHAALVAHVAEIASGKKSTVFPPLPPDVDEASETV